MTLPQNVEDALKLMDGCISTLPEGNKRDWQTIRAHLLSQDAEIERKDSGWAEAARQFSLQKHRAELAESRLAAANALLLRYCVQIGELTKGLDPHDPIYIDIQRIGADYMIHLQGAGDEA